ncbi:MAG: hypothetical protein OWS74_03930, partial [Firmicutes bacterium]|nr:hypothetical protein [Bacillota bacterium]
ISVSVQQPSASPSPQPPSKEATPPAPPGAGPYSSLQMSASNVQIIGTATSSGHTLDLVKMQLHFANPTSGIIQLALNDFEVIVPGQPAYSWNDYADTSLTASTSLFSLPVTASVPASAVVDVFPGQSTSGYVTVQVPSARTYDLVWSNDPSVPIETLTTPAG